MCARTCVGVCRVRKRVCPRHVSSALLRDKRNVPHADDTVGVCDDVFVSLAHG